VFCKENDFSNLVTRQDDNRVSCSNSYMLLI